jgi:ATP-binding cassette, subfamily C (CFTR/MRP), member 4
MEALTKNEALPVHPREKGGIFSYLTFTWVNITISSFKMFITFSFSHSFNIKVLPLLLKGRKKELGLEDLYQPLSHHHANTLGSKLEKAWENELRDKRSKNKSPSLMRAGLKVFGPQTMITGIGLLATELAFKVTSPLLLGGIVRYYASSGSNESNSNISEAYIYAGFLILCSYMNVVFAHGLMLAQLSIGLKIRVSACSVCKIIIHPDSIIA